MNRNWKSYCDEVGLDEKKPWPQTKYLYYAYKAGSAFGPFDTKEGAEKFGSLTR